MDPIGEIVVIIHNPTPERFFKQTIATQVRFVDCLGVGAKHVGKGTARGEWTGLPVFRGLAVLLNQGNQAGSM